jgi:hypothetical protein
MLDTLRGHVNNVSCAMSMYANKLLFPIQKIKVSEFGMYPSAVERWPNIS